MRKDALSRRVGAKWAGLALLLFLLGSAVALVMASSAVATHVRPKGATPKRDSLVIAYKPCGSPNASHAPPHAGGYPTCNPPVQTSPWLTAGTLAANGLPANFIASTRLDLCPAGCAGFPPSEDIKVNISITDVRCTAALAGSTPGVCPMGTLGPYTGSVKANFPLQITDHCNVLGGPPPPACPAAPGTAATGPPGSLPFSVVPVPCALAGAGVGATCTLITTFNVVAPGMIVAGQQANIEVGPITINDGGADGDATTVGDGDTLFAHEGVFAP